MLGIESKECVGRFGCLCEQICIWCGKCDWCHLWCQLGTRWCQFDPFDPREAELNGHFSKLIFPCMVFCQWLFLCVSIQQLRDLEPNLSQMSHSFWFSPKLTTFICKQPKRPVAFSAVHSFKCLSDGFIDAWQCFMLHMWVQFLLSTFCLTETGIRIGMIGFAVCAVAKLVAAGFCKSVCVSRWKCTAKWLLNMIVSNGKEKWFVPSKLWMHVQTQAEVESGPWLALVDSRCDSSDKDTTKMSLFNQWIGNEWMTAWLCQNIIQLGAFDWLLIVHAPLSFVSSCFGHSDKCDSKFDTKRGVSLPVFAKKIPGFDWMPPQHWPFCSFSIGLWLCTHVDQILLLSLICSGWRLSIIQSFKFGCFISHFLLLFVWAHRIC